MLWYIPSDYPDVGVAVSYLIIIGDLMPQVVGSIFPGSKSMPFLLDRQFWITTFMYNPLPSLIQARDYPTVIFKTTGFVKVYVCRGVTCTGIFSINRRSTFPNGRYPRPKGGSPLFPMGRTHAILFKFTSHHLCIYMSSKCTPQAMANLDLYHRQRD
jgi:hypothetical protein